MVAKHQQKTSKKANAVSLKALEKTRVEEPPLSILDDEEEEDASDDEEEMESELQQPFDQSPFGKKKKIMDASAAVIYIGHLPNLLGEAELLKLLKQFGGSITHVRVSRSEKTGNSRGYAFVRVKEMEVAEIIVGTLSGYLLFSNKQPGLHRRLVCHIVPPDKVHPRLFVRHTSAAKVAQERKLRKQAEPPVRSIDDLPKVTAKLIQQERRKRQAIQKAGIEYTDFPGYEKISPSPSSGSSNERNKEEAKRKKLSVPSDALPEVKSPKQTMAISPKSQKPKQAAGDSNHRTHAQPVVKGPKTLQTSSKVFTSSSSEGKKRSSLGDVHDESKQHKTKHKKSKRHSN
jgi:nucleolar protein 15